jgi:hypothetical protein
MPDLIPNEDEAAWQLNETGWIYVIVDVTPGPRVAMRPIDRAAVSLARHAPGVSRLGFRRGHRWRTRA